MTTAAISNPAAIPSPMLSVPEACAYLKIRKSALYLLIGSGDLPARKLGARTLILKSDADDLIERLPQRPIPDRNRAEDRSRTQSSTRARREKSTVPGQRRSR
jgi:excisionase family DNA binding protein